MRSPTACHVVDLYVIKRRWIKWKQKWGWSSSLGEHQIHKSKPTCSLLVDNKVSNGPPPEWRCKQMPSYCLEGLGWPVLELTDVLCPLEKVHSRMVELMGLFLTTAWWVTPPTESSTMALCPCNDMFNCHTFLFKKCHFGTLVNNYYITHTQNIELKNKIMYIIKSR